MLIFLAGHIHCTRHSKAKRARVRLSVMTRVLDHFSVLAGTIHSLSLENFRFCLHGKRRGFPLTATLPYRKLHQGTSKLTITQWTKLPTWNTVAGWPMHGPVVSTPEWDPSWDEHKTTMSLSRTVTRSSSAVGGKTGNSVNTYWYIQTDGSFKGGQFAKFDFSKVT